MSFHTDARKVRKVDMPFTQRRAAFRSCIESYIWLINGKFNSTYTRFSNHFGLDTDVPNAADRLSQAMEALEKERNLFLEKLRLFDKKRIREKARGQRSPSESAVEALYNLDWLEVRSGNE